MIGRLQNELVAANAERSKQYQELAATKRQLTFAEGQVIRKSSPLPLVSCNKMAESCRVMPGMSKIRITCYFYLRIYLA